jgi:hypothetical protein
MRRLLWTLFATQNWALWTTRNKVILESKIPQQSANLIFKTFLFMQQWRVWQKAKMLSILDEMIALLKARQPM